MRTVLLAALAVVFFGASGVSAEGEKPIQLGLFDPVQIHDNQTSIKGVRLSLIYGVNQDVRGLDVGFVNRARLAKGFQYGVVGYVESEFVGWQDNLVNVVEGSFKGFQSGGFNSSIGFEGVQLGIVNLAESVNGLQFGFFNMTNRLEGIQIGIVNIAKAKDSFPVLPIVNWAF